MREQVILYASEFIDSLNYFVLPPIPPPGAFDVRYETGRMLEDISVNGKDIQISSATYPIRIRVEGIEATIRDKVGGSLINEVVLDGDEIIIVNEGIKTIEILGKVVSEAEVPTEYTLFQNYPNPFNPTTKIKFALPTASNVKLDIYNILGENVRELVNQTYGSWLP